jgi:hypothetical protein
MRDLIHDLRYLVDMSAPLVVQNTQAKALTWETSSHRSSGGYALSRLGGSSTQSLAPRWLEWIVQTRAYRLLSIYMQRISEHPMEAYEGYLQMKKRKGGERGF